MTVSAAPARQGMDRTSSPNHASERATFCHTHDRLSFRVTPTFYDARPCRSRFLQVDPVEGGSANDYDYAAGDPINSFDLDGNCIWIGCSMPGGQHIANFAGGVLDTITFGQEKRIEGWAGVEGNVRHGSGWHGIGVAAGFLVDGYALGRTAGGVFHGAHAPMPPLKGSFARKFRWLRKHPHFRPHIHLKFPKLPRWHI